MRGGLDLDGDVENMVKTTAQNASPITLGWGAISWTGNRKGYVGNEPDDALAGTYSLHHVRDRVLNPDLARWLIHDPLGYVDGANLYEALSAAVALGANGGILCSRCPRLP